MTLRVEKTGRLLTHPESARIFCTPERRRIPSLLDGDMTLSKCMTEYLRFHVLNKGGTPGSVEQYERTFRSVLGYLQAQHLSDDCKNFNGQTVLGWSLTEGERGVGPRTLASRLGHLSSLAKFMGRLKDGRGRAMLTGDPTKEFDRPRYTRPPQQFLYPEELSRFLDVPCPLRESLARDLLLDTMLRVSELANFNVGDLEETGGQFFLRVRVKGSAVRRVVITPTLVERVKDYLLSRGMPKPETPLLLNKNAQRWTRTALTNLVARIARQAGVTRFSVSAHKLRHKSNVVARRAGLDAYTRSALLNHSDTRTVAQYDHLLPDELIEARARQHAGLETYLRSGFSSPSERALETPKE
jgi:site-specific recombinase XerD